MNRAKAVRVFMYSLLIITLIIAAIVVLVVITAPDNVDPMPVLSTPTYVTGAN
jgi:hypothetical protein